MKAIFVQIEEKKTGVKVTAWWQNFLYEESRHHVYLTKNITRNDKKSTVPAFAKVTQQQVPDILKANVYFWRPGGSVSWRRSNEERRNSELAGFMRNNKPEAEKKLNEMFAEHLREGEKILVDRLGFQFLLVRLRGLLKKPACACQSSYRRQICIERLIAPASSSFEYR